MWRQISARSNYPVNVVQDWLCLRRAPGSCWIFCAGPSHQQRRWNTQSVPSGCTAAAEYETTVNEWSRRDASHLRQAVLPSEAADEAARTSSLELVERRLADHFGLGPVTLQKWRRAVLVHSCSSCDSVLRSSTHRQQQEEAAAATGKAVVPPYAATVNPACQTLVASAARDLDLIVSPLLALQDSRAGVRGGGPTWICRKPIETGMFLLSMPVDSQLSCDAAPGHLFEDQDPSDVELMAMMADVEGLSAALLTALVDPTDPHHTYAQWLRRAVNPPRNLPFMKRHDISSAHPDLVAVFESFEQSIREPLCPALAGVAEAERRWAASHVLSRRFSPRAMCPAVDLINHDGREPNAHYSAAARSSSQPVAPSSSGTDDDRDATAGAVVTAMTEVDVLDNLMAGVSLERLFDPHLHVVAITPLRPGDAVTISYADQDGSEDGHSPRADSRERVFFRLTWGFDPHSRAEPARPRRDSGKPSRAHRDDASGGAVSPSQLDPVLAMVGMRRAARRREFFPR